MKNLSRSPIVWISATALSAMLYFFAFHFFPQTFPIINLNITMDLDRALEQAEFIAQKNNIGPADYRSAAMFHTDNTVKTFVELEAGGKDAFVAMMENNYYMPYTWQIRHFKEHETNESLLSFTPDGTPYNFIEALSENLPGAQLSEQEARIIAEKIAATDWNIDFTLYQAVETSQKAEISNRIDHTFVYERTDAKIGEGTYRLKIVVSGDKATELTHFVKVPEAFLRRYSHMRSANMLISFLASIIILLLYFGLGGIGGCYWIFKNKSALIKQPIICAAILALLSVCSSINQLPFLWMKYNNAFSIYGFLGQLFLSIIISFIGQTIAYAFIIMVAESLTRRAFGNQPQLWSVLSRENMGSTAIAGRTFGAYLLVGCNVAFAIAFYMFSLRYLGWWAPADMLFDPNTLATYIPWFNPVALSLNAGFIEECLFRAIPLAGAALLGNHYGNRKWLIAIAFILQAIIFGAAHANYPVQPSYARLLELLIPSFIFAAVYLRYGLLTTIIAHTVYDIIWFSIPIFISYAAGAASSKVIIVCLTLLPLFRVVYARVRNGRWLSLPASEYNATWKPSSIEKKQEKSAETASHEPTKKSSPQKPLYIFILGILGALVWIYTTRFTHDGVTITLTRDTAIARVEDYLAHKNVSLTAPWHRFPLLLTHYNQTSSLQHTFIWKKEKKDTYHALLGHYLEPAHWTLRYAQLDTDIIDRTEEYKIMLYNDTIYRDHHMLPESKAGASLSQQEARSLAHTSLQNQFRLDPASLVEISATQHQLPNRTSWIFIFANPAIQLSQGQARISIVISGDQVADAAGTIHVPEEWIRKQQHKQNILGIIKTIFFLILACMSLLGLVIAYRQRKRFHFSRHFFYLLSIVYLIETGISILINWPNIIGNFNTSLPFNNQLLQALLSIGIATIFGSLLGALLLTYVAEYIYYATPSRFQWSSIISGISLGFCVTALSSIIKILIPENVPLWPSYAMLSYTWPLLGSLLSTIKQYIATTSMLTLGCMLIDTGTASWQKNKIVFIVITLLYGISMTGIPSLKMIPLCIAVGMIAGSLLLWLYRDIIRYNFSMIPLSTGVCAILSLVQEGIFNAYPQAWLMAIINSIVIGIMSVMWYCLSCRSAEK
jgi:Type II CAAX prenyl endopeptidase Rce1-like